MDRYTRPAIQGFQNKIAILREEDPANLQSQKTALLEVSNRMLKKNAINKEKTRLRTNLRLWREAPPIADTEENNDAAWVDPRRSKSCKINRDQLQFRAL